MNKKLIIIGIVLYLVSTAISYTVFSRDSIIPSMNEPKNTNDKQEPLTEACPLNGKLYSKSQRKLWESRRPLGVMVENHVEARPQSGLSQADIVHEAVAEGGITRFLAIFYCDNPEIVGPVRSARMYFLKFLQGFGHEPLYGHVGGANTSGPADALGEIKALGWSGNNDLDQFAVPFPNYWRDYDRLPDRATEHTMYTNTLKLWDYAAKSRGFTNVNEDGEAWDADFEPWLFQDEAEGADRGGATIINFGFWDNALGSDFTVTWTYDPITNSYARTNGGKPHMDFTTGEQLTTKNIVVVFADESVANDGYDHGQHLLYDIIGKGEGTLYQNGKAIDVNWEKLDEEDMMRFYDSETDREVTFVPGQIWIELLPTGNEVTVKKINPTAKPTTEQSKN
ncbi:DUF3048 domain-containing protein [Candidatus Woesebacteria bacterium]|nr:DUF3048 domain-containing protein [Candidatus Woesebacteria bacterium]